MRPRQSLLELFSTFIQFAEERFKGWLTDPKLRHQMERCLKQIPDTTASENFWVLYWYKQQNQPNSLATAHLVAYLQEPCYWSAQQIVTRFINLQYKLSDCFQIAITQVDIVLKGFNPQYSNNLKSYAKITFSSILTNRLRQNWETDLCTDWALLQKVSQKRLETALRLVGLSIDNITCYRLAWVCFNTLYVSGQSTRTQQLPQPGRETWEAIAQLYNSERHHQLGFASPSVTPETLEQWLKYCARQVRFYLYPQTTSLNITQPGQESGEWLDNLPAPDESLLAQIIAQEEAEERQSQQVEISALLESALKQLDAEIQTILRLYYGENLTQQQLAKQLETKQYTISRRLSKGRESLLKALLQWSQITSKISLTTEIIQHINEVLEEWLQNYYKCE